MHMPSLGGATEWLNSEPLGPAELRGHVVIVDFWTLTCINRVSASTAEARVRGAHSVHCSPSHRRAHSWTWT
jgi:hypothetical protein